MKVFYVILYNHYMFIKSKPTPLIIIIILSLLLMTACNFSETTIVKAENGFLDLSKWNFQEDEILEIRGEWHFNNEVREIPDSWSNPSTGYGLYALEILMPTSSDRASVYIESQGTAYTLSINQKQLMGNGIPAKTPEEMVPEKIPQSSLFSYNDSPIEISLEISNFHHRKGGFRNPLILGSERAIKKFHRSKRFSQTFSFSIYLILGIYHIIFFIFRKKNKEALFFALFCFILSIRVGFTNQKILLDIFPFLSWGITLKIEYLTFYLAPPIFYSYFSCLYPGYIKPRINKFLLLLASAFSLFTIFNNTISASKTIPFYQIIMFLIVGYLAFALVRLLMDKKEGSILIATASMILIISTIIDVLFFRDLISFGDILPFSFLTFIFIQALILSSRYARTFTKVENLSGELEATNQSLIASESKYRSLFEQSSDMIILTDKKFHIIDINLSVHTILGYSRSELFGRKVNILIPVRDEWLTFVQSARSNHVIHNIEIKLQKASGDEIYVLLSAEKRTNPDGTLAGYYANLKDITDRKKAEEEKIRALELEKIAFTDPLTGLYNRRFFDEVANKELSRGKRRQTDHTLCLLDIDHFKKVNDTYGHLTGDNVLEQIASYCKSHIRSVDIIARYGGEEFVILLTDIPKEKAVRLIEKMRSGIEDQIFTVQGEISLKVTISAGIVHYYHNKSETLKSLLDKADQALYRSKESGRNSTTVFDN